MKIQLTKQKNSYSTWLTLDDDDRPILLNSLGEIVEKLLVNDYKLTVKEVFLPFFDNCIGITKTKETLLSCYPIYNIIYSNFDNIKVNSKFAMCDDRFKQAIGKLSFHFCKTHYFSITKDNE